MHAANTLYHSDRKTHKNIVAVKKFNKDGQEKLKTKQGCFQYSTQLCHRIIAVSWQSYNMKLLTSFSSESRSFGISSFLVLQNLKMYSIYMQLISVTKRFTSQIMIKWQWPFWKISCVNLYLIKDLPSPISKYFLCSEQYNRNWINMHCSV